MEAALESANNLEASLKRGETHRYYPDILAAVMKEGPDIKSTVEDFVLCFNQDELDSGAKEKSTISLNPGKAWKLPDCEPVEDVLFVRRLTPQAFIPTKASIRSAGLDIFSAYSYQLPAKGKVLIMTDLQVFFLDLTFYIYL